jgi:PAS domain S-box-containing protein
MGPKKAAPKNNLRQKAEEQLKKIKTDQTDHFPGEAGKLIHELQVHQIELEMQNEELRRAEAELDQARRKYADLFNFSPVGYCVIDSEGVIKEVNHTIAAMFGSGKGHLVGKPLFSHVLPVDRPSFLNYVRKALSSDRPVSYIVRMKKGAEELFWAHIECARIDTSSEFGPGCLMTLTNITGMKELERERQEYVRDLESFTYAASHELRSPLIAIAGFSRILTRDYPQCLEEEQKRMLTSISENAKRMERLLSDLREFSQVSAREIIRDTINMESLFRRAYVEVQPNPEKHRIAFALGKLPPAQGDIAMIRRVLVNLLSNAVKFTSQREHPEIVVQGHKGNGENLYSVRDNGVGFDMQYAEKLFKVFHRLHGEHEFPGTGAGLSIAKRIIEKHGGRIWAEAKPGEGATFYFTLPT